MLAKEVMIPWNANPIHLTTPLAHCLELMKTKKLPVLPVLDKDKHLIGQISIWQLLQLQSTMDSPSALMDCVAKEIMETQIKTVNYDQHLELSDLRGNSTIWVLRSGEIYGIISHVEIARTTTEYLQCILDYSFDYCVICDNNGNVKLASKSYSRLTGIPLEKFMAMNVFNMPDDGLMEFSASKLAIEKGQPITVALRYATTNKETLCTVTPIYSDEGKIKYTISNGRDISEITQLKEQLMKSQVLTEEYKSALLSLKELYGTHDYVFHSKKMRDIQELIVKIAKSDASVLIHGESGVGKEIIANLLNKYRNDANEPFVKINCAALSPQLIESELFGYIKGAYTGAEKSGKAGLFEAANKGTIYLDEISEIPMHLQAKLLRAIQEKEIYRIGSTKPIRLDIRIIASTNKDLYKEVAAGRFRQDLMYRLMVIPIYIPPLRERKEDIIPLIMHFLQKNESTQRFIDTKVADYLLNYSWPGNVRELQNLANFWNATIPEEVKIITVDYLPENIIKANIKTELPDIGDLSNKTLNEMLTEIERKLILSAKKNCKNQKELAHHLGLSESGLSRKLKRLSISI